MQLRQLMHNKIFHPANSIPALGINGIGPNLNVQLSRVLIVLLNGNMPINEPISANHHTLVKVKDGLLPMGVLFIRPSGQFLQQMAISEEAVKPANEPVQDIIPVNFQVEGTRKILLLNLNCLEIDLKHWANRSIDSLFVYRKF
jgi:hypothetical protein